MSLVTAFLLSSFMGGPKRVLLSSQMVTPFAHGKSCAFSLEFDDSITTQVKNVVPLLSKYKFPATFYINPGRSQYKQYQRIWEEVIPMYGHELADHTWNHGDTVGAEKASEEIGSVAKLIEKIVGHPTLTVFGTPGGVKWDIPADDFKRILKENRLIFPGRQDFYQDGNGDITRFPKRAIDEKIWRQLGFHGVGGEWLSTSVENLTTLIKYLDKNRDKMWIAPTGTVWKYLRDREALTGFAPGPRGLLIPQFDHTKLQPFELYDVPLTMHFSAPATWKKAVVKIDGKLVSATLTNSIVEFDFSPQAKSIKILAGR